MIATIIYSVLVIIFIFHDLVPLIKNKQWKTSILYSVIIVFSLSIIVLYAFNVKVPSPAKPIKNFVTKVFNLKED